jgi:hypothetical protein
MSSTPAISPVDQRQRLRRRLQAQRQVIALQLESAVHGSYPRSRTMRFLTQRPAQTIRLLVGLATLLMTK